MDYNDLQKQIDTLENVILSIKKVQSRIGEYRPIIVNSTTLNLITERGSQFIIEDIKESKKNQYTHTAYVTCDRMFTEKMNVYLKVDNKTNELKQILVESNGEDEFEWNESNQGYIRCFYDGMMDKYVSDLVKFKPL